MQDYLSPIYRLIFHPEAVRPLAIFWVWGSTVLRTLGWRDPFAWQSNKVALFYSKALSPHFYLAPVNKIQVFSNNNQQNIDLPSLFTPVRPLSTCVGLDTALPHWTVVILSSPHKSVSLKILSNLTILQPYKIQAMCLLLDSMLPLNTSTMSFFLITFKLTLEPPVSIHIDFYLQGRK